jgi:WD40 repeat protein
MDQEPSNKQPAITMKSPFKFLDSYTKEDRDIFFGREREIEELYHRVFESKIMLVYGVSGTGKSSLIHCGLANKFQETDWLPLVIRRGSNILDSLASAIKSASITPQSGEIQTALQFKKAVRSLYLDHYKPVYFIFDQFEELFIFGSKEEDEGFIKILKSLLASEIQCKFIFILREEFLGWLTTFEKSVPGFFSNRIRIEKMDIGNARKVIEGPCKIYNIDVQEGFADKMLEKLCPPKESEIELTYLQVYLDKIFRLASEDVADGTGKIIFHISDLDKAGNVYDILGSFLDEQISQLPDPEVAMTILKAFVSARGTKRPVNIEKIREYALSTGKIIDEKTINDLLISFVNLRILQEKDRNEKYELRHDALASKIFEKITMIEKELLEIRQLIENAYHSWEKRGILLSAEDLQYIGPYETRLYLPDNYSRLVESSKRELVKAQHRRRNMLTAAAIALIIILTGFTLWAVRERGKAVENEKIANEAKTKATTSEADAIKARDKAVESDTKAIASEKEAIKARDAAKESESRALYEKTIAEKREIQAQANNFNFLSKEEVAQDPTIALQLAMYALSLDSGNEAIHNNLSSIYYDNSFYKILFRVPEGSLIQISPDWTKIVSSFERTARICGINGDHSHLLFGHLANLFVINSAHKISRVGYDNITSINFSPDGSLVLTGSQDKTARLWDINGNNLQIFKGHLNYISSVVFSPDGKKVLTGSFDRTAKLWDLKGNCLKTFSGHKFGILSVAFSPDGQSILTGSADSTAILWDLDGNTLQTFKGHAGYVLKVAFSNDGKTILTGSSDQTARLWDLSGKILQIFSGHTDNITSMAFSPDGKTILTGSSDNTARLWDIHGNTLQIFKGHSEYIYSVAYSPDGKKILTSSEDGTARVWDISNTSDITLAGHKSYIFGAAFSPDGKNIMTISYDRTVKIWDNDGKNLRSIPVTSNFLAVAPDGKSFLVGILASQLIDLDGNKLQTFTGHYQFVYSATFSPDGKKILTGSQDKTARLWDLNGKTIQIFKGHAKTIVSVAFSPDGNKILTGSLDETARLWDLKGNTLQIFKGHINGITSVAYSPDGKTILTGSGDKTARLWDLSGNTLQVFKGHTDALTSVSFSPDGKTILTGSIDKTVRLWDLHGNTLQILTGYKTAVYSASFSPDGKTILTASGDNTTKLIPVKRSFKSFLSTNGFEKLNLEQELKYNIFSMDQINSVKNINRLPDGLTYFISELENQKEKNSQSIKEATSILERLWGNISEITDKQSFYRSSLEIFYLSPQKFISDIIEKENRLFLASATKEEIKEAYEFYSQRCSNMDSVKIQLNIPDYFIRISRKLLTVDTTAKHIIATDLQAISWPLIQNKRFKTSLEAVNLALEADSTNPYIYSIYPLALLLNNRYDEAESIYRKYYKEFIINNNVKSNKQIYLEDIADLERRGIAHPGYARIKELLNQ